MAQLLRIKKECEALGCHRHAEWALFVAGKREGEYCRGHGAERLAEAQAKEDAERIRELRETQAIPPLFTR